MIRVTLRSRSRCGARVATALSDACVRSVVDFTQQAFHFISFHLYNLTLTDMKCTLNDDDDDARTSILLLLLLLHGKKSTN